MNISFLNRTFDVSNDAVYVRESGTYARIELPGRDGATFVHYVPCKLQYTVEPAPQPLTVIMPVSAAAAISHTNVRVLAFKDVSLFTESMRAA